MPKINISANQLTRFSDKEYPEYKRFYPKGINLHPDSEDHLALLQYVLLAVKESYDGIEPRYATWREIDRKVTTFVDLTESERALKRKSPEKPVSIVIPQNYATREILLTYMIAAFLESPYFRYETMGDPEDTLGVILLESLVEQQATRRKMGLNLITAWSDDITYGFGGVGISWKKILGTKTRVGSASTVTKYEGNELHNFDPYSSFPDLNVPVAKLEEAQYFAFVERRNYMKLLNLEDSDETVFNVQYLKGMSEGKSIYFGGDDTESGRMDKTELLTDRIGVGISRPIDVLWVYLDLIPEEIGLGSLSRVETWLVGVAADRVIISAHRINRDHGHLPVALLSSRSDGHSILCPSALEIEYPVQHGMDWLWGTHQAEVRKTINNMLIADPSLVNMPDLMDTKNGMIARLNVAAWGRGMIDQAVKQLDIKDVTRGHLADIGFLKGLNDEYMGISPSLRGLQERQGERVSSREAGHTRMSAISRREKDAKITAMQFQSEIAYQLASNTLQLGSGEVHVKILGKYVDVLREEYGLGKGNSVDGLGGLSVLSDLENLDVDYDVVTQDGTIPSGDNADVWERLINNAASHPELYRRLDFVQAWLHVARLLGAKNARDFLKVNVKSEIREQGQIDNAVTQGNAVPLREL